MFPDEESVFPDEEHRFHVEDYSMLREVFGFTSWSWTLYIVVLATIHH